ncbi:MAG: hypothetical protein AB7U73_12730 [Pirellulales bacterium]
MTLDDIRPTSTARYHDDPLDVDLVEQILAARFPAGYREFIARFGAGVLAGCLRIYAPRQALRASSDFQEPDRRPGARRFWQQGGAILTTVHGSQTIVLARTLAGSELVFERPSPNRIYALPGNQDLIYLAGDGFLPALQWALTSGVLIEPGRELLFEPRDA